MQFWSVFSFSTSSPHPLDTPLTTASVDNTGSSASKSILVMSALESVAYTGFEANTAESATIVSVEMRDLFAGGARGCSWGRGCLEPWSGDSVRGWWVSSEVEDSPIVAVLVDW